MGMKPDLTGLTFGKVTVIGLVGSIKNGARVWDCECACSNHVELTTQQLMKYGKNRDCGCGIARAQHLVAKEEDDMIALRLLVNGDILEVEPSTVVITDLLNGRVLLTAIDNAQHVSITADKQSIDKALYRLHSEINLTQWTIDSESYNTMRPSNKKNTAWRRVKTLITIRKDTEIIRAAVNTGVK